ncbi:hypothetical protein RB601_008206 [Gaeumannomyces tritici]
MNFGGNSNNTMASGQPAAGSTEKADFGDKAFDFASKKAGHPVDRNAGEKITDAARGVYEKATGCVFFCLRPSLRRTLADNADHSPLPCNRKKVNPKISN